MTQSGTEERFIGASVVASHPPMPLFRTKPTWPFVSTRYVGIRNGICVTR